MWNELKQTVQHAVRFQDNVVDATPYFFKQNENQQMSERRIGLGTIGLAEMLIHLGLRYGSAEAWITEKTLPVYAVTAYEASVELAREKGVFAKLTARNICRAAICKICRSISAIWF